MVAVDVGMRRVHALGREVANVLLDDRVDLDVGERVEPHVGKVEMEVVRDAQLCSRAHRLALLARADSASPGYCVDDPSVTTTTRTSSPRST
jgi:hypothetical protein